MKETEIKRGVKKGFRPIRFILYAILFCVVLVMLVGAGSFYYFTLHKPDNLSIAPIRTAGSKVSLEIKQSHITIPVELNIAKLESEMRKQLPPRLKIDEKIRSRLGILLVHCVLTPKGANIAGENDFINLELRISFNCNIKLENAHSISTRVRGDLTIMADAKASITENWKVTTDVRTSSKWHGTPTFTLFNQKINLPKKTVDSMAKSVAAKAKDALKKAMQENLDLKDELGKFWTDIQKPNKINDDPPVWLWAVPEKIYLPPWKISNNILQMKPAIQFKNLVAVGDKPKVVSSALPSLTITSPKSDTISLAVPLILGYDALKDGVAEQLLSQEINVSRSFIYEELNILDINVYPSYENIVIELDVEAKGIIPVFDFSGKVFISGKIDYDNELKIIKIYDVSYKKSLDNILLSYFVWAIHYPLQQALNKGLEYDLSEQESEMLEEANKQMSLTTDDGVQVQGNIEKIEFSKIFLQEDNLFVYIYVDGLVKVTVK